MKREVELVLGELGYSIAATEAERHGLTNATLIARAAEHYLASSDRSRPAARIPRFARPAGGETLALTLNLERSTWDRIDEEARRQGVAVERLLTHAALLLIADLDSGDAPARIAAQGRRAAVARPRAR